MVSRDLAKVEIVSSTLTACSIRKYIIMNKEGLEKAKLASKRLEKQIGHYVSVNYGIPDGIPAQYFLVIYSDDKKLKAPSEFEEYKVFKHSIPRPL